MLCSIHVYIEKRYVFDPCIHKTNVCARSMYTQKSLHVVFDPCIHRNMYMLCSIQEYTEKYVHVVFDPCIHRRNAHVVFDLCIHTKNAHVHRYVRSMYTHKKYMYTDSQQVELFRTWRQPRCNYRLYQLRNLLDRSLACRLVSREALLSPRRHKRILLIVLRSFS